MVKLNHCWVQLTHILQLSLLPFYIPLVSPPITREPTRMYDQPSFDTPSLHSLSILLFTVLLYLLSTPPFSSPVTRPSLPMTSPHLTLPFYISFLYSFFNPSLPSTYISSYVYSPFDTPTLLTFPFHPPYLLSQDNPPDMTSSPMTLPLYIPILYSLSTLLPLDTSIAWLPTGHRQPQPYFYFNFILGYCHGTAQSPLGSPPVTRQPPL